MKLEWTVGVVIGIAMMMWICTVQAQPDAEPKSKPQASAKTQTSARQQAVGGGGYYEFIPWRANDPFVFCKYGPPPEHCWKPVNPILGLWVPTCLPYKQPNMVSVAYFVRVCPQAEEEGEWVPDNDGTPTTTPFVH